MTTYIICFTITIIVAIICVTYYKLTYIKYNCDTYKKLEDLQQQIDDNIMGICNTLDTLYKRINYLRDKIKEIDNNKISK